MEHILQSNKMLLKYLNVTQGTEYCILSLISYKECSLLVTEDTTTYSSISNFSAHTSVLKIRVSDLLYFLQKAGVRSLTSWHILSVTLILFNSMVVLKHFILVNIIS